MDATASGASGIAGWLPLGDSVSSGFRVDDTALTASLPGFEGEHTPAFGCPAEMRADGEVVWSWRPTLASSPAEVLTPTGVTAATIRAATVAIELVSPGRAQSSR